MYKDVEVIRNDQNCQWCKSGLMKILENILTTAKVELCRTHKVEFLVRFAHQQEAQP